MLLVIAFAFHYITICTPFWLLSRTFSSFSDCLFMSIDNNLWCTRIDYFSDTKYRVSVTNNTAIDFELKQRGELAIIDVSKISKIF